MSIGSLSHWGFNAIVAVIFLSMINHLGLGGTFCLYAIICIIGLIWGYFYIPETKGITLEQIEEYWKQGGSPRRLGAEDNAVVKNNYLAANVNK